MAYAFPLLCGEPGRWPVSVDKERLAGPAYAVLELTYACPAFCPGCPGEKKKLHANMTAAQWETVLDRLAPVVEEVRLSGGEAVNHPEFRSIVEILERSRIPFIVFTAGLWERPRQTLALFRKSRMLRGLSFSVHGATEEVHDRFLSFRSFNDLLSLLTQVEKASIPFQTSTVLGNFNRHQVKEIIRLAFERGSRFHLFRRYIGPIRHGVSILRKDLAEILSYIQKVRKTGLPVEVDGCVPPCFFPNSFHCSAGVTHCSVDPSGNVKACSFAEESYGNLLETSIRRIWSGRRLSRWVSRVPVDCEGCAALSLCRGGCHVLQDRFTVRHDPLMEMPLKGYKDSEITPRHLSLEKISGELRPFALFRMRKERRGYSLILSGEVLSVSENMSWLSDQMKGIRTLSDLEAHYGEEAALFILWLYEKGFVEMNRSL